MNPLMRYPHRTRAILFPSLFLLTEKIVYTYIDIKLYFNSFQYETTWSPNLYYLSGMGEGRGWVTLCDMFNVQVIGELYRVFSLNWLEFFFSKVESIYTDWVRYDFLLDEK